MFQTLPDHFRQYKLKADVRTLLLIRTAMERGLVHTIGDMFALLKTLVPKNPKEIGPYTIAFYDYFLSIPIAPGETLEQAVAKSDPFAQWREQLDDKQLRRHEPELSELVDRFLQEIHRTSFEDWTRVDGRELLDATAADMEDQPTENGEKWA